MVVSPVVVSTVRLAKLENGDICRRYDVAESSLFQRNDGVFIENKLSFCGEINNGFDIPKSLYPLRIIKRFVVVSVPDTR